MFAITNGNDFDFEAAYDGKKYAFPKGKAVAVNVDAATHIFAVGREDKNDIFLRHGWFGAGPQDRVRAEGILKKFKFDSIDSVQDGTVIAKERSASLARAGGASVSGGSLAQEASASRPPLE